MKRIGILAIPLLLVLVLLVGMGAGTCGGGVEEEGAPPEEEEEEEAPPTSALPQPGEWVASTGCDEFTFTFTVSSDSTAFRYDYHFLEFGCGGVRGTFTLAASFLSITGSQFTVDRDYEVYHNVTDFPFKTISWHIVIQGEFDQNGTYASGTWEISAIEGSSTSGDEETACTEGTWEASAP